MISERFSFGHFRHRCVSSKKVKFSKLKEVMLLFI